ncbi:MAG: hypothetical protein H7A00_06035 [Hahellaceae bacterium]|nr:hypothetical protein [Hahellaceae bacterium]
MRGLLLFFVSVIFPTLAFGGGWDTFGKHGELKDYVIAEVGDLSAINPPVGTNWGVDLFKINARCIAFSSYNKPSLYSSKAALLLVKSPSTVKLAVFEDSISSIKVELYSIEVYECPYGSAVSESAEILQQKLKEQLEVLKKQQQQLEELRGSYSK